ncbi:MAG: pyruvate, water dikinase, partial [Pseudomonadales bacterium]|nr:pyruvate, water dikinase [Pseudomonadales bacterium]
MQSLQSQRATAYQQQQSIDCRQMNVVVQLMVDASSAGVLFSVDPVSGRHDRCVIDAVSGLGETLVSGEQTPDHYEFDKAGRRVFSELIGEQAILSPLQCRQLFNESQQAVAKASVELDLDLEWAIDQSGKLYWLQARPITTIGSDLNELDTPIKASDVLTGWNVGEM